MLPLAPLVQQCHSGHLTGAGREDIRIDTSWDRKEGTVEGRSMNWDVQESPAWLVVDPWGEEGLPVKGSVAVTASKMIDGTSGAQKGVIVCRKNQT